jgi:hypothetical protein
MAKKPSRLATIPSLSVAELFDALSAIPRLLECPKCGSKLLYRDAAFSHNGKVWTLQLPICPICDLKHVEADTCAAA